MSPTWIGFIVFGIGLWLLLSASRLAMLMFALACTMFNGSAVVTITALGSVSVQPGLAATGLLFLRILLPERRSAGSVPAALRDNGWLILLATYGFVGAYTLPLLFSGAMGVVPLRPSAGAITTIPLGFSTQNITTSFYLLTTMLAAIAAHATVNRPGAGPALARTACTIALVHATLGWIGVAIRGTAAQAVFEGIRNGHYMQVEQSFGSWARLNGVSPEPSIYAAYGFAWLVVVSELWLRNIIRGLSGPAALLLLVTLIASTSTTAYLGIGSYALILVLRVLFVPASIPTTKTAAMIALALAGGAMALAMLVASEQMSDAVARILRTTTTDKLSSGSGVVRSVWARQGLDAFLASYGLGIGVGSFRSSSIITALIGSGGVIAATSMALYLGRVFRPFRAKTWRATGMIDRDTATACAWGAVMALVPAAASAPSPDPGILWGLLAGAALGLNRRADAGALPATADPAATFAAAAARPETRA